MKQLDPKAVYLFFFNFLLRSLVLLIPLILISNIMGPIQEISSSGRSYGPSFLFNFINWLWLIIPIYIILCYIWSELTYRFYRYELLDTGFRKESGVIYKKYVTIPYDRIQNVNIDRDLLARILGLSDLSIETAGFSAIQMRRGLVSSLFSMYSAEGRLPGLSIEVAEQLRDELIDRAHKSKNQGL